MITYHESLCLQTFHYIKSLFTKFSITAHSHNMIHVSTILFDFDCKCNTATCSKRFSSPCSFTRILVSSLTLSNAYWYIGRYTQINCWHERVDVHVQRDVKSLDIVCGCLSWLSTINQTKVTNPPYVICSTTLYCWLLCMINVPLKYLLSD